ncbi:MAG: endolytic transglycosylase MltG [Firmicutes bacterium]|nr:endolytic transglycosylase MltG [Bacillota bacterium]
MNKIRDLIYDFNDIFVALLIVLITAGIVFWRVGVIMDYPSYLAAKSGESGTEVDMTDVDLTPEDVDKDLNENPDDANSAAEGQSGEQGEQGSESQGGEPAPDQNGESQGGESQGGEQGSDGQGHTTAQDATVTIPSGTYASGIAKILYDQGLVPSTESFLEELRAQGKETRVQAGTFKIPAGSSISDIVKIITRTN